MGNLFRLLFLVMLGCSTLNNRTPVENPTTPPKTTTTTTPDVTIPLPAPKPTTVVISYEPPKAVATYPFKVNIKALNYTEAENKKLKEAVEILERVLNSPKYREAILASKFTSIGKHETSESIYNTLKMGNESLIPELDNEMDLTVKMYYKKNSTVGYTYPNSMTVYTNSHFHKSYSACKVASNLAHEWTHKMGYGHSSSKDFFSVPYSHNDIIEDLCKKRL